VVNILIPWAFGSGPCIPWEIWYNFIQMNYDEIDVEKEVKAVEDAIERGDYRHATKKENMAYHVA
jgi:hypothetical protein